MDTQTTQRDRQHFHAHESPRSRELDGVPLAAFWQRLLGYLVDLVLAIIIWAPLEIG